ncbi:hypothetical protein CDD83_2000 [Cordyceps sp. RAO-2017]|nr:hypothetical protein CDD83_2000 [Cordyceps sp. RAO-2017]
MSSSIVNPSDIDDLLQQVGRGRIAHGHFEMGGLTIRPYYAASLILSETQQQRPRERDGLSLTSSATPASAIFDAADGQSLYSVSTAPPVRGPEPLHRQRAPVPDFAASWLPCEFRKLSSCPRNFAFDQVDVWIRHIVDEHLQGFLPSHCLCWFCDGVAFQAASGRNEDLETAYYRRMEHIALHFFGGQKAEGIRPDFHFLDHVHDHGLISEESFQREKRRSELRPPRGLNFGGPPAEEQVERRRHSSRPHGRRHGGER